MTLPAGEVEEKRGEGSAKNTGREREQERWTEEAGGPVRACAHPGGHPDTLYQCSADSYLAADSTQADQ